MRADGHEVGFVGTPSGPEARLAREAGLVFHGVKARGFDRSKPLTLPLAIVQLLASAARAWSLVRRVEPDVIVGFGGYVSLPVGVAAVVRRVPLVLHEQNSVPGLANRLLCGRACAVGVTYRESIARMKPGTTAEVTGNPVRDSVLNAERGSGRASLGIPAEGVMVLVFGGSRGARHVNEAVLAARDRVLARDEVHVVHIAGPEEASSVRSKLDALGGDAGGRYRVLDYVEDMGSAIAAADLVVARAGATSIAEITAVGRPAILVPYPYATEDHQTLNARDVEQAGAAVVVRDADLDDDALGRALDSLLADDARRADMAMASREMGVRDASERLERLILGCARPARSAR